MQKKNFVKSKDEVTDYLACEIEKRLLKRREISSFSEIYQTTHLTQCERRIIYRANGVPFDDEVEELDYYKYKEWNFEVLRNKWVSFLRTIPNVSVIYENHVLAECVFNIGGKSNILKIGKKHVIFEVKQVDSNGFEKIIEQGPRRAEIVDIMAKMWISEIKHGILIYDDSLYGSYKIFHITPYEPIIKAFCRKCENLNNYKINGKLPDRIYQSENDEECQICEYKQKCWANNKKEKNTS